MIEYYETNESTETMEVLAVWEPNHKSHGIPTPCYIVHRNDLTSGRHTAYAVNWKPDPLDQSRITDEWVLNRVRFGLSAAASV